MLPLPAVLVTTLLTWSVVAGSAVALTAIDPRLGLVPAVLAAITVPSALPMPRAAGVATGAVMLSAAAVPLAPAAGLVAVGVFAALALALRAPQRDGSTIEDLQRHLSWCRRRETTADVLALHVPGGGEAGADTIRDCFRLTDSVHVDRTADGYEVTAVLDTQDLVRDGLEQRVRALLGEVRLGWARFPDEGVTLEALADAARASAHPATAVAPARMRPAEAVS